MFRVFYSIVIVVSVLSLLGCNHSSGSHTPPITPNPPTPNLPPIAIDDSAVTMEAEAIIIDVLSNDSDPQNYPLQISNVSSPSFGTANASSPGAIYGTIIYMPNLGFIGTDNFSYTIDNGNGGTATANVTVTVNLKTPSFTTNADFSLGSGTTVYGIVSSDFNGDLKPDIAVLNVTTANNSRVVSVFLNTTTNGYFSFSNRLDFPITSFPGVAGPLNVDGLISVEDINQDGLPDLIVTENSGISSGVFRVLLNNSSGPNLSFATGVDFAVAIGFFPYGAVAKDLNADGLPEVCVVTNNFQQPQTTGTVEVFSNTTQNPQTPNFASSLSPGNWNFGISAVIEDFNGDNLPDIAAGNNLTQLQAALSVMLNTSAGGAISFAPQVDVNLPGWSAASMKSADLNNDGKKDLVVLNPDIQGTNWLSILANTTTNPMSLSFAAPINLNVGPATDFQNPLSVIQEFLGDVNGDSRIDLITFTNNLFSVYLNSTTTPGAAPSFANKLDFNLTNSAIQAIAVDLNQDGIKDLVFGNIQDSISVLINMTSLIAFPQSR